MPSPTPRPHPHAPLACALVALALLSTAYIFSPPPDKPPTEPGPTALCEPTREGDCVAKAQAQLSADPDAALATLRFGCDKGAHDACVMLADLLLDRDDRAAAADVLDGACRNGHRPSCVILGDMLSDPNDNPDYKRALFALNRACASMRGSLHASQVPAQAHACGLLGDLYADGLGVDANPSLAQSHWRFACDRGWGPACTNLGRNALDSDSPDPAQAQTFLTQGCDHGDPVGCCELSALLRDNKALKAPKPAADYAARAKTLFGQLGQPQATCEAP